MAGHNDKPDFVANHAPIDHVGSRSAAMNRKSVVEQNFNEVRKLHAAAAMGNDAVETPSSKPPR